MKRSSTGPPTIVSGTCNPWGRVSRRQKGKTSSWVGEMPEPSVVVRGDHQPLVAVVFCVEPGRLESEACLLVESIRQFGGRFANAPLYAVQPRHVDPLRPETVAAFGR